MVERKKALADYPFTKYRRGRSRSKHTSRDARRRMQQKFTKNNAINEELKSIRSAVLIMC